MAIGVNHVSCDDTDQLALAELAGAVVPSGAWNNVTFLSQGIKELPLNTVNVFDTVDGSSFVSGITTYNIDPGRCGSCRFGWFDVSCGHSDGGNLNGNNSDDKLMYAGAAVEYCGYMTFASLPPEFAETGYDVYVYLSPSPFHNYLGLYQFRLDIGNGTGECPQGPTVDLYTWASDVEFDFPVDYLNNQSGAPPNTSAKGSNYVVFRNVGRGFADFTVYFENVAGGSDHSLIAGIQVVQAQ